MTVDYKTLKNNGFMHQVQKNHFSLRLKVIGGNLSAGQLITIAAVSKKYGDGHVHLTSRQGVEIPFIKLADIDAVRAALEEGEVSTGVCGPRVRTVTACQGCAVCPSGCIDTHPLAVQISDRYLGRELPHKFKFGITGCMNNCLKAEENDIGIKGAHHVQWIKDACTLCGACAKVCPENAIIQNTAHLLHDESKCRHCGRCAKSCPFGAWSAESGYILSFGGRFGKEIAKGKILLPIIRDKDVLFRVTDASLDFFYRHAHSGERFRVCIERMGWDALQSKIEAAFG